MGKQILSWIVGLALMLGYWTVRDKLSGADEGVGQGKIPAKIWEGGRTVRVRSNASDPGTVSVTFETNLPPDDPKHRFVETWEKVPAGPHTVTIDVPPGVSSTVERSSEGAKPGSTVEVSVEVQGAVAARDADTLSQPLEEGYGFFAQLHFEDLAQGKLDESD